ncbi:hypothetical protein GTY80_52975 [Amycolatopsis sp. SID8362]|nr:hypothetical protein [Amycolatopsis sp. SID8362]
MARTAHRGSGRPVSVGELMLRSDVHGRRRPEDLEVLEMAYRMRRRTGPAADRAAVRRGGWWQVLRRGFRRG